MTSDSLKKLETVKIELVMLVSRLTEPYRSNVEASIKLIDDVIAEEKQSEDITQLAEFF